MVVSEKQSDWFLIQTSHFKKDMSHQNKRRDLSRFFFGGGQDSSANGKLLVWVPGVWDSKGAPLK